MQPDVLFQAIDDQRLGVSTRPDPSLCIFCQTTPAGAGYASCAACRAHNSTLATEAGRPRKSHTAGAKAVPKKEEVMSESTPGFVCPDCQKPCNSKRHLGVHRFHSHGVRAEAAHKPKATGVGVSVKQPEPVPVPAPVQAVVDHVNETHIGGRKENPEHPTWTPPLASGPALPARTDLRFEVIITRLGLISAELEAGGVSAPTRAVIEVELLRVRNLVDELEAGVA